MDNSFPFLAVLATGGHTEIVLTRGVGLHTVMGFTIDIAIGNYLDRVGNTIGRELVRMVNDGAVGREKLEDFVGNLHAKSKVTVEEVRGLIEGETKFGGAHLEKFARYGDARRIPFPIPQVHSTNITLVGLETHCLQQIYGKQMAKPESERRVKEDLTLKDLFDVAASAQFAAFFQISRRVHRIFHMLLQQGVSVKELHLVGGVSCN